MTPTQREKSKGNEDLIRAGELALLLYDRVTRTNMPWDHPITQRMLKELRRILPIVEENPVTQPKAKGLWPFARRK